MGWFKDGLPFGYGKCVDEHGAFKKGLLHGKNFVTDKNMFSDNPKVAEEFNE